MAEEIILVDVNKLDPNPFQARINFPEHHLRNLGESLKRDGIIEPILIRCEGGQVRSLCGMDACPRSPTCWNP